MDEDATERLSEAQLVDLWKGMGLVDATAETVRVTIANTAPPKAVPPTLPRLTGPTGDYQMEEPIAGGGTALIHRAYQHSVGRDVAMKRLREEVRSERTQRQLLREGRIAGALEHPNVVPVHAVGVDEQGEPVLVMKRIQGRSWTELLLDPAPELAEGETRLELHLGVLMQVSQAVSFAHAQQVLHRDLKPDNVMIGAFGEVYLLDWGIALRLEDGVGRSESISGTPGYMAPEMVGNRRPLDARTDVFLLGAVLHEILTGEPPNMGESVFKAMLSAYHGQRRGYPPGVPGELIGIARRAMAAEATDRFPSAEAFRLALKGYLRHRDSHLVAAEASEASARLSEALSDGQVRAAFGAARFGFEQALRLWPENAGARAELREVIAWMARYELGRGDVDAAEHLVSELDEPSPKLLLELEAARNRADKEDQELAALRTLGHEMDMDLGASARSGVTFALGVILGLTALGCGWAVDRFLPEGPQPVHYLVHGVLQVVLAASAFALQGRDLFQNRVNRMIAMLGLIAFVSGLIFRLLIAVMGTDYLPLFPLELGLYAFAFLGMGFFGRKRLALSALPVVAGAFAAVLWPPALFYFTAAGVFLAFSTLALFWHPRFTSA